MEEKGFVIDGTPRICLPLNDSLLYMVVNSKIIVLYNYNSGQLLQTATFDSAFVENCRNVFNNTHRLPHYYLNVNTDSIKKQVQSGNLFTIEGLAIDSASKNKKIIANVSLLMPYYFPYNYKGEMVQALTMWRNHVLVKYDVLLHTKKIIPNYFSVTLNSVVKQTTQFCVDGEYYCYNDTVISESGLPLQSDTVNSFSVYAFSNDSNFHFVGGHKPYVSAKLYKSAYSFFQPHFTKDLHGVLYATDNKHIINYRKQQASIFPLTDSINQSISKFGFLSENKMAYVYYDGNYMPSLSIYDLATKKNIFEQHLVNTQNKAYDCIRIYKNKIICIDKDHEHYYFKQFEISNN